MVKSRQAPLCPCGSEKNYEQCCKPYIDGTSSAPDALALMRSRYTAYTLDDEAYLQKSWHPSSRTPQVKQERAPCKWVSLQIISHHQEGQAATVEFIAKYKINGRSDKLHETSRFVCEDGQWFYVDGEYSN